MRQSDQVRSALLRLGLTRFNVPFDLCGFLSVPPNSVLASLASELVGKVEKLWYVRCHESCRCFWPNSKMMQRGRGQICWGGDFNISRRSTLQGV